MIKPINLLCQMQACRQQCSVEADLHSFVKSDLNDAFCNLSTPRRVLLLKLNLVCQSAGLFSHV